MTNIQYKKLIFLGAFAFMLIFTHSALAYTYPNGQVYYLTGSNQWDYTNSNIPQNNYNQNNYQNQQPPQNQSTQNYQTQDNYKQPAPAIVLASNTNATKAKTVSQSTSTTVTNQTDTTNTSVDNENANNNNNGLTALSVAGTNKFMPDTVFEWILVVILILVIIIIARQFRKKDKHEIHHEVSPVGHH